MGLSKLPELKEKLMLAEKIGDVWDYFFDHFGEDPEFMALGKRRKSPFLRNILVKLGRQLYGPEGKLTALQLVVLRKHRFAHGSCFLGAHPASVMYFADVGLGSVAATEPGTGRTHFVRFTEMGVAPARAGDDEGEVSFSVPPGARSVN